MQKKYKKIILALLVLFLLGSLAWFIIFFRSQTGSNIIEQTRNNFPFGQINPGTVTPQTGNQGTIETDNTQETIDKEPEKTTIGPRLRRISDFPTGGFAPIIRIDDKEVTDISIDANGVSSQVTKTIQVENNYVRYSAIDDATLYDSQLTPSDITDERLTENYIPNAEHVYFSENGEHALFQYWNPDERLIETYLGNITKADLEIDACPYDFETPIELGDEGMHIFGIHKFLNTNRQTRIATQGINSPGNEGSLAIPATITAIKNFQSLHELDIDGKLGPATQAKMLSICNEQQGVIAEQKLENLEEKYNISGFFLPQKITALDINPTGKNFFYITEGNNNVTGTIHDFETDEKKEIFTSPYTEWLTHWNSDESLEIVTKPSYLSEGYSYEMNPSDGDYHKSFKQKNGLNTLASPDNKNLFVFETLDNTVRSSIFSRNTKRMRPLSIQTFPEKCTWAHDNSFLYCFVPDSLAYGNEYPDIWYQGIETYTDSMWKIDPNTLQAELISDIKDEYDQTFDVIKIGIDKNSDYLYFIDKNTEELWSYRLQNA